MSTYVISPRGFPMWQKDPAAVKDYSVDWTPWLGADTIDEYTVTVQNGLVKESDSRNGGVVTIWLSGGTPGKIYKVTVHVETAGERIDERTFEIEVRQQ